MLRSPDAGPVLEIPVRPDAEEARRWATEELARGIYRERPGLLQRLVDWLRDWLADVTEAAGGASWVVPAVVVSLVAAAVAIALVTGLPARRARASEPGVLTGEVRSAARLRADAEAARRAGDFTRAVLDRFRAVVRALADRTLIEELPGLTAHEAMASAAEALGPVAPDLLAVGRLFDAVRYGHRPATAAEAAFMADVADRAETARPARAPAEVAP